MKIQICSDLHLEFLARNFPGESLVRPHPDAEILLLAGDIGVGAIGLRHFLKWPVPVLYVAGNHEFYGGQFDIVTAEMNDEIRGSAIQILQNSSVEFDGYRFLGATMWTDYELMSPRLQSTGAMIYAGRSIADHHAIMAAPQEPFSPEHALREHIRSKRWLEVELRRDYGSKTIVMTHHAPSGRSIHPNYEGSPLNAAFASNLDELVDKVDLWVHGHMHNSFDYRVGDGRVVCNPRGYPLNRDWVKDSLELVFENPEFKPDLVVAI